MKNFITILFILFASVSSTWAENCILDGSEVELVGTISRETFPGPPNYESIEKGDKPETYWIFTSQEKFSCAKKFNYGDGDEDFHGIDGAFNRFQLAMNEDLYKAKKPFLYEDVRIKGKVFAALNGHHHTKMLIEISDIQPAVSPDNNCQSEAKENAGYWNVDLEAPYNFTKEVVDAVREKDLNKLSDFIKNELEYGPRKRSLKNKKFSDIFTDDFRQEILDSGPTCYVHSWRGVMLGNGKIWIKYDSPTSFYISSITEWKKEIFNNTPLPLGWTVDGKTLAPSCFFREWISSDNLSEFAERFSINDFSDFKVNMGKYLGTFSLDPFKPSWCETLSCDESDMLSLISPVERCTVGFPKPVENNDALRYTLKDGIVEYEILDRISVDVCQSLAPSYKATCKESYLVRVGDIGGSIGILNNFSIYGLFEEKNGRKVIAPLVNFDIENEAKNFVEDLKSKNENVNDSYQILKLTQKYIGIIDNKYKIKMNLDYNADDNKIDGVYFYERFNKDIKLSGKIIDDCKIQLEEYDEQGKPSAVFEGTISDDFNLNSQAPYDEKSYLSEIKIIAGTWRSLSTNKILPFNLMIDPDSMVIKNNKYKSEIVNHSNKKSKMREKEFDKDLQLTIENILGNSNLNGSNSKIFHDNENKYNEESELHLAWGNVCLSFGNNSEAFESFKKAAEKGNVEAQVKVSAMYLEGNGTSKNYSEANKWLRKAATKGHTNSQFLLGLAYYDGEQGLKQDHTEAAKWIRKAAVNEYSLAQYILATMYVSGLGVPKNYEEAFKWHQKAAEQGEIEAQFNLGAMYDEGHGIERDYSKALKWYQKAADKGHASAHYNIGIIYFNGRGVLQNWIKAYAYINVANALGNKMAIENLSAFQKLLTPKQILEGQQKSEQLLKNIQNKDLNSSVRFNSE